MTYYEALARIFNNDADREAENCLPFLLSALQPLDSKFFETLEAVSLVQEKSQCGYSYWFVRELLIFGVQKGALEFLNGLKLKDTVKPCDDLDAWQKSIAHTPCRTITRRKI